MAKTQATETAFRAIYDRYFEDIARYCMRRLPVADAHDAVAEVFLVAWRRIGSMPEADDALPWLYGVARNVVRNSTRAGRRSRRLEVKVQAQPAYPDPGPEVQVVRHEEDEELLAALGRLKPNDQEVLRLRAYEGLTVPQISLVLGCSEEAAKKRVARALKRLRRSAAIDEPDPTGAHPRAIQEGGER